jgi:heat shock protein HtpX
MEGMTVEEMNMGDGTLPLVHSFVIDTELSHSQLLAYPKFIREHMAFGQLPGIVMGELEALASAGGHFMEFKSGPQRSQYQCLVRVYLERPIKVEVMSSMGRDQEFEKQLQNVILMVTQFFEEEARKSTLYMAFVPGSPKTAAVRQRSSIFRAIFSGNMINLFMISILIGLVVYAIMSSIGLRLYAPVAMIALMLSLVLSAGRLVALRSPWKITSSSREVVLVQHQVPEGMLQHYVGEYRDRIKIAKGRAYELYAGCPGTVCAESMAEVFTNAGLPADKNDFLVRRIDIYSMVERVAQKFGLSVPTIVISQDPRPNAAATGFTKRLGTMIITMGLLVQLDEKEIELVVGHELSHLRSGDPIVLFSLVMAEYLARVYIYWQYIAAFWIPYLLFVFWAIFFFGKFLESRADLEAGLILRKPKVMAESLKKIGFRRLVLAERFLEPGGSRLGEWLKFDPHPPLYFRIQRLEALDVDNPPKHPFLSSVKAVTSGFLHSRHAP